MDKKWQGRMSKMQNQDLVSVVIVAKNEQRIIKGCIENVMALSYGHKEIVVIDNESTDRMPEILSSFTGIKVVRALGTLGAAGMPGGRHQRGSSYAMWMPTTSFRKTICRRCSPTIRRV